MELQLPGAWGVPQQEIGTLVAIILTLCVFSYLLGNNALFRLAEHLFVGVALGYAALVAIHSVLVPRLLAPAGVALWQGDWQQLKQAAAPVALPLVLGVLLLTKAFPRARSISWLGNLAVAVLLGVGAALAIGGALLGTLLPQMLAAADVTQQVPRYGWWLGLFSGALMLLGTAGVLLHFRYASPRPGLAGRLVQLWAGVGRWLVVIAFGALLATTFLSRLSLLTARLQFLLDAIHFGF
jgi:hypothetical protein